MLRRGMMAQAAGGGGSAIFTNDGTLAGWDGSSGTWSEDTVTFSPTSPALFTSNTFVYRNKHVPLGRRFRVRMRTTGLCNIILCANSSGDGTVCRLETRPYNCGFSAIPSWGASGIGQPAGSSAFPSLAASTWHEFVIVVHPGNTADVSVNGVAKLTGVPITNNGDYFGIKTDGLGSCWYDHIEVLPY